ncbi:MAG TPA: ectonucleotide pyrophosphatase/phosphodiesterase [Gemmatimonadales bacterium]|nr:ectonucleotide pyrophosphatase/phosphodiesterase [Gemmatimonadales bacterium]
MKRPARFALARALGLGCAAAIACAKAPAPPAPAPTPAPAAARAPAPPEAVLLVSIDGFRADYLDRPEAARLRGLAAQGVRARWLTPVFPSKTFPNHYSIVTGLYPEHHGIVSNTILDPETGRWFRISDAHAVRDSSWWGGEPIWVTAVKQGLRSATFFWPGSEAAIEGVRPTYWERYDARLPDAERVRRVLDWLSLPPERAPSLVTLYFSEVDHAGHEFGPDAPETDSAIAHVDSAVGMLLAGLDARGLSGRVDVIVVSDHGMAPLSPDRTIYLGDYLDLAGVTVVEASPVAALVPPPGREEDVYERLRGADPHLAVYRRSETPPRWHYRDNPRIPPILAVADEGWRISTRSRPKGAAGGWIPERGTHGYDPAAPSMRALFIARGPSFPQGVVVPPFTNIHLYALMTHLLGLVPVPNDGSLDSVAAVLGTAPEPAAP